ncbi:MAG: outer membrane beta-barrel protein [Campylobacterota bacterium]|nr:outer membrane beta-barrel protein [Campylobacterota bacterium]
MKNIILFLLLISSLYGDAKVYVGFSGGTYTEVFDDIDASSSASIITSKIGYGDRKAYGVEFSLDYAKNNSKIFSTSPDMHTDGDRYGFNVSLLKAFDFDIYALPFVKVGFGTGFLDIDRELQKNLTYGTFQLTLGTYIPLGDHFDIELGYEIKHTSYEAINTIVTQTSYGSKTNSAYLGVNYRY